MLEFPSKSGIFRKRQKEEKGNANSPSPVLPPLPRLWRTGWGLFFEIFGRKVCPEGHAQQVVMVRLRVVFGIVLRGLLLPSKVNR
jgi:hypothetical protein